MGDPASESETDTAVLAAVEGFAVRCVEPRATHPELAMPAEVLVEVLAEARALGLVASDEPGLGLWDDAQVGPHRTLRALERLARAQASVALALHAESLAAVVARAAFGNTAGPGLVALEGRFGLGRGSLARLLVDAPLDDDDRAMLRDVYGPSARLVTASPDFAWVLWPTLDDGDRVVVLRIPRASLVVRLHAHPHGFDELVTMSIEPVPGCAVEASTLAPDLPGRDVLARALALHALGLVAIAAGAAARAHRQARTFAATRRQGGALIERHAAVALLLASSRGALESVGRGLDALGRDPVEPASLPSIFSLRAEAHPLLCRGANDALQVFGGMGYMRDVGLEKVVRDLNHLRVVAGSPPELGLVVAELERLHG